ncbi:hypothetical protein BD779DRAFT_285624 [Infundibulicybe gibba]|nr:hypothetical protein BD779DRAFT_285624 [Infundibulicybe gibba]
MLANLRVGKMQGTREVEGLRGQLDAKMVAVTHRRIHQPTTRPLIHRLTHAPAGIICHAKAKTLDNLNLETTTLKPRLYSPASAPPHPSSPQSRHNTPFLPRSAFLDTSPSPRRPCPSPPSDGSPTYPPSVHFLRLLHPLWWRRYLGCALTAFFMQRIWPTCTCSARSFHQPRLGL